MRTRSWQVTQALLGKEISDSRGMILGLILLLAARQLLPSQSVLDRYLASFLDYAPVLLAVLWGASNGDPRNRRRLFERTHLPASVYQLWLVSFVCPMVILFAALRWSEILSETTGAGSPAVPGSAPEMLLFFALSYFVSCIWSQGLAVVIGVSAIVAGPHIIQSLELDADVLAWSGAIGSSAAVALYLVLKGIARADVSRGLCVVLLLVAIMVPSTANICTALLKPGAPFEPHILTSANGATTIRAIDLQGTPFCGGRTMAEFCDKRTGKVCTHVFTSGWHAAWVGMDGAAYFLESDPANRAAKITRWNTRTDSFETVTTLPLRPDFDSLCESGHFASVDPSGHCMIARLAAVQNSSVDLWLIDLKKGRGRVVMQSASYFDPSGARWLRGRVLVPSYRSRIIQVDLATGKAVYLSRAGKAY